jgi:hypothetical protein
VPLRIFGASRNTKINGSLSSECLMPNPSIGRTFQGRFALFGPPQMSNVEAVGKLGSMESE